MILRKSVLCVFTTGPCPDKLGRLAAFYARLEASWARLGRRPGGILRTPVGVLGCSEASLEASQLNFTQLSST